MKLRIGAYVTVLGWNLIASAALIGWGYRWASRIASGDTGADCNGCGFLVPMVLVALGVAWIVAGAAAGCTQRGS